MISLQEAGNKRAPELKIFGMKNILFSSPDVSILSDTTVYVLILFVLLVNQINCKGGHP